MSEIIGDIRFALRGLRRSKAFFVAAVACLALGIGATTAIFSVVHAVVLKPLPYKNPGQLVRLYTEFPRFPNGGLRRFWTSEPEFLEMRRDLKSWKTLDAWRVRGVNIAGSTEPIRAVAGVVTGSLLGSLGVEPVFGRVIIPDDDAFGAPRVAVIGEGLWKRAFGGDRNILKRDVWLNGEKCNVVGVMPDGFQFPPGEVEPVELWTPMQINPASPGGRSGHGLYLLGRLQPGITLSQARQEMAQYVQATGAKAGPGNHMLHPENHPLVAFDLQNEVTGSVRPALLAMLAAVGFVLLIACGNVANLLLARAESRQREIAIRRAMGASAAGLIRQFLIEGLLLSLLGSLFGLVLAYAGLGLVLAAAAGAIPRSVEVGIDGTVLACTIGVSVLTGIFFGLAPLLQSLPKAVAESLKSGGRTTATKEAHWLRQTMIAGEMALALVLLIGAALMIGAFWRLQKVESGLQPANILTMQLALPSQLYREPAQLHTFWNNAIARAASLPGVISVSAMSGMPPIRPVSANDTQIEGFKQQPGGPLQNIDHYNVISADYFKTMGIELMEGRTFAASDDTKSAPVVVINETFAKLHYPGQSAIGRRVRPSFDGPWRTIAGVVADVRNSGLDAPAGTEIYFPYPQSEGTFRTGYLAIRTQGDPLSLVSTVRREIAALDPALPVSSVRTMDDVMAAAQARPRFLAMLIGLFSFVAVALAALGMYSVMSYAVAQRTNEFGIRMAMGAGRGDVLGMVLRQGVVLGVLGVVLGAAGALALNRVLKGALYGVGEFDPVPFALMSGLLVVITLLASMGPALRATRVDPLVALRYE